MKILISGTAEKMMNYARAVARAGGEPVCCYAPMEPEMGCDGLILCGGGDISPALYGALPADTDRDIDPVRERSDRIQITSFLAAGKPILGICRGAQILNVLSGGSLVQDLGEKCPDHRGTTHEVQISEGSLQRLYGAFLAVNSYHHQAIRTPAPGFRVTALSQDGVIEAVEHEALPVFGVQWHPERMEAGDLLFRHYIQAAKQRSRD